MPGCHRDELIVAIRELLPGPFFSAFGPKECNLDASTVDMDGVVDGSVRTADPG
jgi:hypothetical protein